MGVVMCLYAQLRQTKNKQCKSAIILQCYHPHLSDFCSRHARQCLDRLKQLNLSTLTYRRSRGDMIETYKLLTGTCGCGAHARAAGCYSQDSYKIRNFGHFLVILAAKLLFHIISFAGNTEARNQEIPAAFKNQLDRLAPVACRMP